LKLNTRVERVDPVLLTREDNSIQHFIFYLHFLLILSNEEKTNDYKIFEKEMIYMKILKKGG
jgi:hypothetical protein